MSNKRHHEIVEIQKSNKRIRKSMNSKHYKGPMKKWRRNKNRRSHLFFMHKEYKEIWQKVKIERLRKAYEKNHI